MAIKPPHIVQSGKLTYNEYTALHQWVAKNLGKPAECKLCGSTDKPSRLYQWANISQEYKKDLSDWVRACGSCNIRMSIANRVSDTSNRNIFVTTHCFYGHEFVESNIYIKLGTNIRECKECRKMKHIDARIKEVANTSINPRWKTFSRWQCNVCKKPYVKLRNCQKHMVRMHNYLWWDDKDICVRQDLNHPTGHTKVEVYQPHQKGNERDE